MLLEYCSCATSKLPVLSHVYCQDLGIIDRMVIGHDGKGSCPRWHLDRVVIVNKSDPTAQPVVFTCGQWFAKDVGDGQIVRTLKLGQAGPVTRTYKVGSWGPCGLHTMSDVMPGATVVCPPRAQCRRCNGAAV